MRKCIRAIAVPVVILVIASCGPITDPRGSGARDLRPPTVEAVRTIGPKEIELAFDEEAQLVGEKLRIEPVLPVQTVPGPGTRVILGVGEQVPGTPYTLEASARDARGNTVSFLADFYGFNPRVPRILLNELAPRGSETHPDLVELKVLSDGNMGGLVFHIGTAGQFEDRLVFPPFEVREGDFILLHPKASGEASEIDETVDKGTSGGLDASDTAFDFWMHGARGLGGNNGVLTLYDSPGGKILDGFLYSNRTSASDDRYAGFGSAAMLAMAEELARDGGWRASTDRVRPEDAVSPDGSTSTRSICRPSRPVDTDTAADWHIVPTRKSSFGRDNSDEVYSPGNTAIDRRAGRRPPTGAP